MKTIMKHIYKLLFLIIVASGLFLYLGRSSGHNTEISSTLIKNRIESAQELVTSKYYYTTVGSYEDSKKFNNWNIPWTTKKIILSYDGTIAAGVDLKEAEVTIGDKQIDIKLPEAKIISHEINHDSAKYYDEDNSIFNSISAQDTNNIFKDGKSKTEKEAIQNGLLTRATEDAQKALKTLLTSSSDTHDYQVNFVK